MQAALAWRRTDKVNWQTTNVWLGANTELGSDPPGRWLVFWGQTSVLLCSLSLCCKLYMLSALMEINYGFKVILTAYDLLLMAADIGGSEKCVYACAHVTPLNAIYFKQTCAVIVYFSERAHFF